MLDRGLRNGLGSYVAVVTPLANFAAIHFSPSLCDMCVCVYAVWSSLTVSMSPLPEWHHSMLLVSSNYHRTHPDFHPRWSADVMWCDVM